MPQQTSPFIEGKYGWNFGESGWNIGADENFNKFSFLFDRNVDGIVSSLPTPVSGQAYFLTTDNRLYFAVNNTWYSSPTPKWFEMKIRTTGDVYQFNGTAAVQIDSPAGIDARLDAAELTISTLGTAAFVSVDSLATQAELDVASATAATYTDTKSAETLASANTYADGVSSTAETNANTYTDSVASTTLSSANSYTDTTSATTLTSANTYTNTLRSDLASTTSTLGANLSGFKQVGTGSVNRTVYEKLKEFVSVKDFGAVGDGTTNDSSAIQAAITAVGAVGGGFVFIPPGVYSIGSNLKPASNVTIFGASYSSSKFIIPVGDFSRNTIFSHTNSLEPLTNVTIENLGFEGRWVDNNTESTNGLITLKYVTNLHIHHCSFKNSRAFGLNINECDHVVIEDNILEYANRDMIGVWGTPRVSVVNNFLRHNNDDGISINWETGESSLVRSQIIVEGNILEDTGPIRTQAPKNINISNNNIFRARGAGIHLGVTNTSLDNTSSAHNIVVSNNVISDVIDRQWFATGELTGSVNNRIYIHINSTKIQAGTEAVVPGELNTSTGLIQAPYDYYYKQGSLNTGVGAIRAPQGTIVTNNICKRTLPAVTNYSDWGYGQAFGGPSGMINYQVTDAVLRGAGVLVKIPYKNLSITGNQIYSGRYGIAFDLATGVSIADFLVRNVLVANNDISDADTYGIGFIPTTVHYQDMTLENNKIDGDPYFISSNRASAGAWTASTAPFAFFMDGVSGIKIVRNTIKNVGVVISNTGSSSSQYIAGNLIIGDIAATGFSASNKGAGNIPGIGDGGQWWLQYENSDPTNASYGQSLGTNFRNTSGSPSAGKWLSGMRVTERSSAVAGTAGSQYVVFGYARATTGTGNVAGTDWIPMRCLTGT